MLSKDEILRRRGQLSSVKRAMLEQRLRGEPPPGEAPRQIPRRPEYGRAPLSFAQQRLWFLDQLEPGTPAYIIPTAVQIEGPLRLSVLQRSLDDLVQRHEVFRTTFALHDARPIQLIHPSARIRLSLCDLQALEGPKQQIQASRLIARLARQPFDLARGPLLRAALLRFADERHLLVITLHHIIGDGWSLGVLIQELAAIYARRLTGVPMPLPALIVQYADFAHWQRQSLQESLLAACLDYWKRQLEGHPAALELPADHPRPLVQRFQGAHYPLRFPRSLKDGLLGLSQREDATLFMGLLAAFDVLLFRYSGQQDILVGSPIANRNQVEVEGLIGCFVNTLVFRTDLSGRPTFRALLRRVRQVALGAYLHQDLPFEKLVEEIHPERNLSYTPLFQVMFALQNAPTPDVSLADLTFRMVDIDSAAAQFDLTLNLAETQDGFVGFIEYNTDLFDATTIARMAGHLQTLLAGCIAQPGASITSLPLLMAAERHQLLIDWNASPPGAMPAPDRCIHELFETEVARTPDAVAVVFDTPSAERRTMNDESEPASFVVRPASVTHLTYAELDRRANQLARHLRQLGVGPEVLVGICVERSLALMIGLLGILKAGGAYVPLDPQYPAERLAFMLEDSGAQIVIYDLEPSGAAIQNPKSKIVRLAADWPIIARQPATSLPSVATPDHLAYMIYTSGSTGRPKGALNTQRGIANRLLWMQETYRLMPRDVVLQKTPISFDVSVWELFWPLLVGARMVLAQPGGQRDSAYLAGVIHAQQITTLHFVPSMLTLFLDEPDLAGCTSLQRVFCSGEALPYETQTRFFTRLDAELHNLYGPTEAAVDVAFWACERAGARRSVPIGRPVASTQIYLLDRAMQPAPIGAPGELYIGGVQLARGYHGRPDLTAERFIPNPFGTMNDEDRTMKEPTSAFSVQRSAFGARLYKTGDLARYQPGGAIEYLGRIDRQVKLRGFRIELGEIEAVLRSHGAVREGVCLMREDAPGERRLVAYVVRGSVVRGQGPGVAASDDLCPEPRSLLPELRAFLAARLPDYMIPSAFVLLDALPLTPNGKLDRAAFPAPETDRAELKERFVAPRTVVEELLAQQWEHILGIAPIGVYENFFSLGGHSLLATQALARIRQAFQVEIVVRRLFEAPTVAGLAQHIEQALLTTHGQSIPPIRPVARDGDLPLSFAQQRLWLLDQLLPNSPLYNISAAVRVQGSLDITALRRSISGVIRRHESLRTTFVERAGAPFQVIAPTSKHHEVRMPVIDLRACPAGQRQAVARRLAVAEAQQPFVLARGPLIRASLLRLDEAESLLLLSMHHIVSDGWSMEVFVRELLLLYGAHTYGQPIQLPALPVQYADYAVWQRDWLQREALEKQLDYWRRQLASPPTLKFPTDWARPPIQSFRGAARPITIPRSLTAALKAIAQQEQATLFMLLLAAFQTLLARYSAQDDIAVGSPVAGRTQAETESLIGFFVNTLVLRTDLGGNPQFQQLLRRVREVALDAHAHQHVPFEKIVEELQPVRDPSRTPLFQVMLVLQNMPQAPLAFPDLTFSFLEVHNQTAKFDLWLGLTEGPDGLVGAWEYNTDLFDAATIARLSDHFRTLLAGVAANPLTRLLDLPLLTTAEREHLLVGLNVAPPLPDLDRSFRQRFLAAVQTHPDAIAARSGARHSSYTALAGHAARLAHIFQETCLPPQTPVAVLGERSIDLLAALLACVLNDAVYLPLDPAYPDARLHAILADSGARLIVCAPELCARAELLVNQLATPPALRNWNLPLDAPACAGKPPTTNREALATIFYTSGSTGKPKGALVTHQGLLNHLCAKIALLGLNPSSLLAQTATHSFDISIWQFLAPLLSGGQVVIYDADTVHDPLASLHAFVRDRITVVETVPTLLSAWLAAATAQPVQTEALALADMEYVISNAETLAAPLAQGWLAAYPHVALINTYGATECADDTTHIVLRQPPEERALRVAVGRPIAGLEIYVLDTRMQPQPQGCMGQIAMAGVGLGRGYMGDPAHTAEVFAPHPYGPAGSRLYLSGDLGRWNGAGQLEFIGRVDGQVKVRGVRVELGEVEAALHQHLAVRQAVALIRADRRGEPQLVAYVVPADDRRPPADDERPTTNGESASSALRPSSFIAELRTFLKARLPAAMAPTAFVLLERLPLNRNGKVDRRALPAPDEQTASEASATLVAPRTPTEAKLAEIWAAVLGLAQVSADADFFALGGHSLMATQVVSRIRVSFQIDLPLRDLFASPTIEALAEVIDRLKATTPAQQTPSIAPLSRESRRMKQAVLTLDIDSPPKERR